MVRLEGTLTKKVGENTDISVDFVIEKEQTDEASKMLDELVKEFQDSEGDESP